MKITRKLNLQIEPDNFDSRLEWLGDQLFAVKDGYGNACITDAGKGEILWKLNDCFSGVEGLCIGDKDAVYIAREQGAKRSISAHERETGKEIWNCYLSTSSSQFCSPLTQSENYIFHTNTNQIYVVEKSTGKLINKFKVAHADVEKTNRIVLPWRDKVLYAGWIESGVRKSKKTSLVLDLYDPLSKDAFIESIITIEGRYGVMHLELLDDDTLFFLPKDSVLRIIDLNKKQACFEHDFVPNGDQSMDGYRNSYISQITKAGNIFHFVVMATETERNADDDFVSHKNFSTLDLDKMTLDNIDYASVGSFDHYYYDGDLVFTGYNTFKPDDVNNKKDIGLSDGEVLVMKKVDDKFYLLQDNEDDTTNLIVLESL